MSNKEGLLNYIHYEKKIEQILGKEFDVEEVATEFAEVYTLSLDDIQIGCHNMCKKGVSATEYNNWVTFVNYVLNENFSLKEKYDVVDKIKWIIPKNDVEALLCIYDMLLALYDEDEFRSEDLEDIIDTIKVYKMNKRIPKEEWDYSIAQW